MRVLDDVPFEVDAEEVFQALHIGADSQFADEINALIEQAREIGRPRALYDVAFVESRDGDTVVLVPAEPREGAADRVRFESRVLRANLDEVIKLNYERYKTFFEQ